MVNLIGVQRADDTDIIGNATDVRKESTDMLSGIAAMSELGQRTKASQLLALKLGDRLAFGKRLRHRLAVHLGQLGFKIEALQVRRSARHAKKYDSLDALWKMERLDYTARR